MLPSRLPWKWQMLSEQILESSFFTLKAVGSHLVSFKLTWMTDAVTRMLHCILDLIQTLSARIRGHC